MADDPARPDQPDADEPPMELPDDQARENLERPAPPPDPIPEPGPL